MHTLIALSMLISLAMSQSLVLEAQDGTCGYLNGMKLASYGCQAPVQKCAVYYPTSRLAADITTGTSVVLTDPATPSFKTLTPRAVDINTMAITSAPRLDYPAVLCCDPSKGDCAAQPTACVDALEHPYSALCTGSCPNDPMTLKCTAGHSPHCNQIEFQSPLYYQRRGGSDDVVGGLDAAMGAAEGPARGWFCGASALPTKLIESTIISRRPVFEDESSLSTAVATPQGDSGYETEAHSNLDPVAQTTLQSTSPLSTASYTVTLTKHLDAQISAVPDSDSSSLQPVPDGYSYVPDATTGEDCCIDEHRARHLQPRRDPEVHKVGLTVVTNIVTSPNQIELATTTATPAAAPAMTITEGLAIVSTAYSGQSDRSPFAEATRSWHVFEPTPSPTDMIKNKTSTGRHGPKRPPTDHGDQEDRVRAGRIAGFVVGGLFCLVLIIAFARWCKKKGQDGRKPPINGGVLENNDRAHGRMSSIKEQSGGNFTTAGNRPSGYLGRGDNPRPGITSLRGGIDPRGRLPPIEQVSSFSGDSADDERNDTNGSSRDSSPYYHAMAISRDDGMQQVQPEFRF